MLREFALVDVVSGGRRTTHTTGFPLDPARMLPEADVVVLIGDDEGRGAMLFRYSAFGEVAGDTWHPSVDDARQEAADEYGDALQGWMEVPAEAEDAHAFAVRYAREQLNDRGER